MEDIRLLVDSFYNAVREAPLIGPITNEVKWRGEKMTEMFRSKLTYYANSVAKPLN